MESVEECTKSRPVLKVLGPIASQVVELRGRQGVECDAQTILRLIKLCHALKESCALLPARLTQHARTLGDSELDRAAGQAGRRLERVVDALTDATSDLYRDGEVDVRDNTEVWSSILDTTEQLLSALTDALLAWDRSQLRRLTAAANQMHSCLSRLQQVHSLQHLPHEFQVLVSSGAALGRLVEWRCRELFQRGQKEGVMVASSQLHGALTLLAKVCVASSTADTTEGLLTDSCHAKVSRELVVNRVKQLVDEVVTQAGSGPSHTPKQDPAAFTTCIDKILDVLLGQEKLKGIEIKAQENEYTSNSPEKEKDSQDEIKEDMKNESQKERSTEEERVGESERTIHNKEGKVEIEKRKRREETEGGEDKTREGVSVRVRPLLEAALQHSLAVACCATQDDHRAIMTAAENVLRQVKVVVNLEQQLVADKVDHQVACDTLADATEALEQCVNTALIRLIVQTFATPEDPLEAVVEALGLETEAAARSGADSKEEGSETGSREEDRGTGNKKSSEPDCPENRGTDRERKQSEESRVENLVADFDLHVDRVFQAGGLVVACTSDPLKVRMIEGNLGTLEWLEGCLVPALLTAARANSISATTHANLLLEHWKITVATLISCLHDIMDPAAFVMVSQEEVQRVWAELRAGLYSQDTKWVKWQAHQVVALTSHVLQFHKTQRCGDSDSDGFLTNTQTHDLVTAVNEVKMKAGALAAAPSDLARHRSLLKRVQLCLTLLARLTTSLNHDHEGHLDQAHLTHADVRQKLAHSPKLTRSERCQLLTSDINDIPLDMATPVPTPAAPPPHHRLLRRSLRSSSRLAEWRPLTSGANVAGEHSVVASGGVGSGRGESVALCDTSIDISRFLSRSTNLLSSIRGSKRNITLKVKEINLDLAGDLVVKPHLSPRQDKDFSMAEVKQDPSLVEVSELIAEHGTKLPPSCQTLSNQLSGILETVTSLVGDLASSSLHLPSPGWKRKYHWESFGEQNKENVTDSTSDLYGIKLQHASFSPHFPDIVPGQDSGLFTGNEKEEGMLKLESSNNGNVGAGGVSQALGESQDYREVWKDFTAIIESHTPARIDPSGPNFSSNFIVQDSLTPLLPHHHPVPSKPCEMKSSTADLSDTPFLAVDHQVKSSLPGSTHHLAASSSSVFHHASSTSIGSSTSVSSSSASITTPQRLQDLQVVQLRLHRLRRSLKC